MGVCIAEGVAHPLTRFLVTQTTIVLIEKRYTSYQYNEYTWKSSWLQELCVYLTQEMVSDETRTLHQINDPMAWAYCTRSS